MTRQDVMEGIRGIFSQSLKIPDVTETTHLFEDLKLDSIQQMTLVVEIENLFRIRLDEGDESGIATVSDLADLVLRRLASENGGGDDDDDDDDDRE